MYLIEEIKKEAADFLLNQGIDKENISLEIPPADVGGDLAFPCFSLAKKRKQNPREIATDLAEKFSSGDWLEKVFAVGPYVNFGVNRQKSYQMISNNVSSMADMYGHLSERRYRIGVEYLSPNTNKPLTIGHARNGSIGRSLIEILKFAGFEVASIILYNDRGIHICKSMLAYQKWGEGKTPEQLGLKPDHMIGKYYVMYNEKLEQDSDLESEVSEMLKKWENGDQEVRDLWKKMNEWFFLGVSETLQRVGISFDKTYLESDIYRYGREIIEHALDEKKVYRLDDGAVEVDLTDVDLDKKILLRKDGTTVYMVQDLYLAKKKIDDLQLDKSIYVVGNEQKYHFDVLFELLDRFKIADKSKTYHLAYAMVNLASGKKMSSRIGTGEKWDLLLDELSSLAKKEISNRDNMLSEEETNRRAEIIAQAALKYVLLNQDVNKTICFNKEEVVRFDGETGPYLLYTYARINSILNKL
nr:arginine--tRNA ligase [bacterium]